eukprot:GFUD01000516.1.p1 GENE.GFUD01000516.1~~GFUD01000516.1.p1  ORF type:complete len:644 (+),score=155.52 GFUD01000516.1:148-2079(+)
MAEMQPDKKKDAEKEKNTATLSKISNAIKGSEKLDVEGTDLLELLSHLEGELQARDVAIAALKSEQIKRVLYGCYSGTDRPGSPFSALQRDKTTKEDANQIEDEVRSANCVAEAQIAALQNVVERQKFAAQKMAACLQESEKQRSRLVVELDDERAKHERDTAQGDDITYELEKERIRLRQDLEVEVAEKQKLEVALKENLNTLEEEKAKQKQIVLVLLADRKKLMKLYLEEKKRSEDLAQMLQDEKTKMETMAAGLEEESKRSLAMEAELEKHISQFGTERQQLREKLVSDERRYRDLEEALRKARADVEHFKKQLSEAHRVAMSQAAPPPPYPGPNTVAPNIPLSVSPTPLATHNRQPVSQTPYANYTNYSTYGQIPIMNSAPITTVAGNVSGQQGYISQSGTVQRTVTSGSITATRPSGLSPGNPVVRSQSGNITSHPAVSGVQPGPQQQAHTLKFHSTTYNTNSTAGGFGHASHPALMPAGVSVGTISHMDQESLPNTDMSAYSQMGVSKPSSAHMTKPTVPLLASSSTTRKPLIDSAASANRKPALGKGVPPPLPPNKPVVPVKKEIGKRSEGKDINLSVEGNKASSSMVAGLQGLKFGISISNAESGKGLKPLSDSHSVPVTAVPAKKFFNNIESKS